jgi:hypothetical protein
MKSDPPQIKLINYLNNVSYLIKHKESYFKVQKNFLFYMIIFNTKLLIFFVYDYKMYLIIMAYAIVHK